MKLTVQSISQSILDKLGRARPLNGASLIGRHGKALNLRLASGELLALVWPELGNGPFHAVLAHRVDFTRLRVDTLQLELKNAEVWEPALKTFSNRGHTPASLHTSLHTDVNAALSSRSISSASPPFAKSYLHPVDDALHRIVRALHAGDRVHVTAAATDLAGLGPGLTPAGDDVLLGLIAGLWLAPQRLHSSLTVPQICADVAETARTRTTTLSAAWIRHAARGEFGEPWHVLARALHQPVRYSLSSALSAIGTRGATSGIFALRGFASWYSDHDRSQESSTPPDTPEPVQP